MDFLAFVLCACLSVMLAPVPASGAEPDFATLEDQFHNLPVTARGSMGPLFWLHGDDSQERLEMYVGKVAEGGNGCFTVESRPDPDWLGPNWFRDLGICLEGAKQHGLKLWIFDEKWFPSQDVAGTVPAQYGSKRLATTVTNVTGPLRLVAAGYGGANVVGTVAGKISNGALEGSSLVDLAGSIHDGTLTWEVPAGRWQVLRFTWTSQLTGNRYLVDGASQDAVDWFLQTVYQPHYDHFTNQFGTSIAGFFYDEPETRGDWGTEVMKVLAERGVDWKKALTAYKFSLAGEEQLAARYQYLDALAEAWGRTLYGGMARWCRNHGVRSIGHFMEHANLYLNPGYCAGDMVQLQKYSDLGAIDAVFNQFAWGQRVTRDAPVWQTPKLASSISHAYGKTNDEAMVEIFGGRGQDLSYPEMKWWADHMQVCGVNFLIPHSFNPRAPYDLDCPPYFFNGGFEPRWPLYRVFADYSSRLSLMLTGGRHVAPVALLYLGQSAQVGARITPEQLSESFQDALYDCDWLPYEVFERDTMLAGRNLNLRAESYRVLVVPPVQVIPYATLAKAKLFFDNGGIVLAHGFLPTNSATLGRSAAEIQQLCADIWGGAAAPGLGVCRTSAAGGRSYLLPAQPTPEELQQVLAGDAGLHPDLEVLEGDTGHWLHVLHRVKSGRDVFFIVNQNLDAPRRFRFRITAAGEPECWDAMRNEITTLPCTRSGNQVELAMTLQPNESTLLVFQPTHRPLPQRVEPGGAVASTLLPLVPDPVPPASATNPPPWALSDCWWMWYPEGDPAQSAPPATRYFRKQVSVPSARVLKKATFLGTADNGLVLFANGARVGQSDGSANGWRNPVTLDLTALMVPGSNQLAISVTNNGPKASPAGLLGKLTLDFQEGEPVFVPVDGTWKSSNVEQVGWAGAAFNDASWPFAMPVVSYGGAPWNRSCERLTLSPVTANPFYGHCVIADNRLLEGSPLYLEMDSLSPEAAACVTVNSQPAGGFIGPPFRLNVAGYLQPGTNYFRIEPFAPPSARLVTYQSVSNVGLPTVSLLLPTNGAAFEAPVTLTLLADASTSNSLISRVDFYANGQLFASRFSPPYDVPMCVTAACSLTLTAAAVNNAGLAATSAPVTVRVGGAAPALPVSEGLQLWLKADAGVTTNTAGAVTRWADQSGKGNDAVQASSSLAPTFVPQAVNNQPALRFLPASDGTPQYLDVATSPSVAITGDLSSFFVVRFEDFATYRCVWSKATGRLPGSVDYWLSPVTITSRAPGTPEFYRGDGTNYGWVRATNGVPPAQYVVLGFEMAGSTVSLFLNEQTNGTGTISVRPADAGRLLRIGTRDDFANQLKGHLAELLIYNRALSVAERKAVVGYLRARYGMSSVVTLPRPALSIQAVSPSSVGLSWPDWTSGYVLEGTTNLTSANWDTVPGMGREGLLINPGPGTAFYRLRKQ